jgi:hypothetical protein
MSDILGSYNIVPLLAPVDITNVETRTNYVDLKYAQSVEFYVQFGLITSASATDDVLVFIEAATAVDGAEAAISGYTYRKSGAVGANTWGAITTETATGTTMASDADDGLALMIKVDPQALAASDYRYARVFLSTPDDMTATLVGVTAFVKPRYTMTTHLSTTASASA